MKKAVIRGAALAMAMTAGTAWAGGLWLNEYGDFAGGRAGAGAAAGVDEAMTIAYNPASISRLQGNQLFASAGAVVPQMNFDIQYSNPRNGYGDGGDAGEVAATSSMAYLHDLDSDTWRAGIAVMPLSGASMKFHNNWVGRYQATEVSLLLMALSPTVAYRINDSLSVGATLQGYYADLELDFALPRLNPLKQDGKGSIDGDDLGAGYTLGAMYELSPTMRFGVLYQSKLKIKFGGNLKTNYSDIGPKEQMDLANSIAVDTDLDMADYARFSVHQDLDEHWSVDFTVGWDNWSTLGSVFVSTQDGSAGIATKWKDTYHYAWGAQYALDERWDFTAGIAYDSNPVSSQNRNAQLPIDKQIRYAVGVRHKLTDSLTVGGYVNYADLGKAQISNQRFGGEFDYNNALQLITNISWAL